MCVIMISAPPSPTRNYTLFPDATLFRSQFADEFLEEPGDVGLKPAGRLVSASSEEQQHVSVRGHPGGRQNPQRFSHAGAALPDQRSAQRILVQVGLARDFAAVAAAHLTGGVQQFCEDPPGLGFTTYAHVNHSFFSSA